MVWFEDDQISAELVQMRLLAPEQWGMPLPLTQSSKPVINAEHDVATGDEYQNPCDC